MNKGLKYNGKEVAQKQCRDVFLEMQQPAEVVPAGDALFCAAFPVIDLPTADLIFPDQYQEYGQGLNGRSGTVYANG